MIAVDDGATLQDALNKVDTSHIVHNPEFTFDTFACDRYVDLNQKVNPCSNVLWYNAVYSSFPVYATLTYYDKDGNCIYEEVKLNGSSTSTNRDLVQSIENYIAGRSFDHYSALGKCIKWELEDAWYDMDEPVQPGQRYGLRAIYENAITDVRTVYIDEDGEVIWKELGDCIVTSSTTYRDILNNYTTSLSAIEHNDIYSFKGWTIKGVDLDDPVSEGNIEIIAEYATYPVSISYSYYGDNGIVTDVIHKIVPSGTDMEALFKEYNLSSHNKANDFTGWKFFMDAATSQIVDVLNLDYVAAASYTDIDPVWVITAYVDQNGNGVQGPILCYASKAPTYNSPYQDIEDYFVEVTNIAYSVISPLSKYPFTSFNEDIIALNLDDYPVFTNYTTAASLLLLPDTDKTQVTFIYPDGTQEVKILDSKSTYKLPETYDNKAVIWQFEHPFYMSDLDGGEEIILLPTYFTLTASFKDGSQNDNNNNNSNNNGNNNNDNSGSSGNNNPSVPPVTPVVPPVKPVTPPSSTLTPPAATVTTPVRLSEDIEKQVIADIQQAAPGTTVKVNMTNDDGSMATVVTKEMLLAAQDKDVTIELNMGSYSWTIYGKDIKALDDIHDVDLEVIFDTNAIPSKTVQALAGNKPARQLSLTYNGDFGFKASLNIYVDKQYSGTNSSLYYYDSSNKLVFIDSNVIDPDGYTTLDFSHASDYVIIVEAKDEDEEIIEKDDVVTETEENQSGWLIALVIAAVAVIGAFIILKNKKR